MTLLTAVVSELRPVSHPARVLYTGASIFAASAVVHVIALAADGWGWSGAVSFRKPLTFSVSVGLLLATSGWVLDRLPSSRRLAPVLAWSLLISSIGEVGLITLQSWRGRASHFNTLEAGDAAIFAAMGLLVAVMSLCLVSLLVWSIRRRPSDSLTALAVIAGLTLVTTGLGIGQWIIELGNEFVARNRIVPDTVAYGEAGVAKFPHAIAFHGIQVFIVASVMLRLGSLTESMNKRVLWQIVIAYSAILVFASIQTILGLAPLAPGLWSLGLVLGFAGVGYGYLVATRGLSRTIHSNEGSRVPLP